MSRQILGSLIISILFTGSLAGCHGMKARLRQAESHYEYGMLYLQNGKYNLAYREFEKARKLNPKDHRLYHGLGLINYFQGNFSSAIREYQRAIDLNQTYPDAYNNMAAALAKLEQWPEVIQYADKALAVPSYATPEFAHYNKGIAYFNLGEYERARIEFEISLELDPTYIDTHYQLGLVLLKLASYSRAADAFEMVLQLIPMAGEGQDNSLVVNSHYYLGLSRFENNEIERAVGEFQKVIELAPESERAREAFQYLNTIKMK